MREVHPECLRRFAEVTQTNQLLKGVKGEFSAVGNKRTHTRMLLSPSADMHVRASAAISLIAGLPSRASLPVGPVRSQDCASPRTANCNHTALPPVKYRHRNKHTRNNSKQCHTLIPNPKYTILLTTINKFRGT